MSQDTTTVPDEIKQRLRLQHQEIERLSLLLDISKAMSSELAIDKLLIIIMDKTKYVLDADRCSVFLLDKDRNELWTKVAHGMDGKEIRIPANMGLVGHVVMTGKVLNVPDAYDDPRFDREVDKKTGYRTRTILSIPMKNRRGEVLGVFQVLNKREGVFTHDDEELLEAVALHSAVAVENAQLYLEQKESFNSFVETLAATIDARDPVTAGHSHRVMQYCMAIAEILNMASEEREVIRYAALLHDFGKIGVRESVLFKNGRLDDDEFAQIKDHVLYTKKILKNIKFARHLKAIPTIAASHHEQVDGHGYSAGLSRTEIPFSSRIMAVADVFDAITSKRHYRDRMEIGKVVSIIRDESGTHFDDRAVRAFFKVRLDLILSIILSGSDVSINLKDRKVFAAYTLNQFADVMDNDERTRDEKKLVERFNTYYQYGVDAAAASMD